MKKYKLQPFSEDYTDEWNEFVEHSINGTIFHRLDFLDYHDEGLKSKAHHLVWLKGEKLFAVMPLSILGDAKVNIARSPYGASYGGIVTRRPLSYEKATLLVSELLEYLKEKRVDECYLTFPILPAIKEFSETLSLVLLEHGFRLANADISSVVKLDGDFKSRLSSSLKRTVKKAEKDTITCKFNAPIDDFWRTMEKTFEKHGSAPTHNYKQLSWLHNRFPKSIYFDVAYYEEQPISGICHFVQNSQLDSSFYLCNDPEYEKLQGLSLLIYKTLQQSKDSGYMYFDFGTSSVNMNGRKNIFRFKEKFGSVGYFRNTYRWKRM